IWVVTHSQVLADAIAEESGVTPRTVIRRDGATWLEGLTQFGTFEDDCGGTALPSPHCSGTFASPQTMEDCDEAVRMWHPRSRLPVAHPGRRKRRSGASRRRSPAVGPWRGGNLPRHDRADQAARARGR